MLQRREYRQMTVRTVVEGTKKPTHYLADKGAQVNDSTLVEGAKISTQYVTGKGAQANDTIVEGAKKTSEHVPRKVVTAKDVTMRSGKEVVHCVDISSNVTIFFLKHDNSSIFLINFF